jgi:hypothetical protein
MKHTKLPFRCGWIAALLLAGCDRDSSKNATVPKSEQEQASNPAAKHETKPNGAPIAAADSNQVPKRGPKQKYPKLISSPPPANAITERLARELSGIRPADPNFKTKVRQLWRDNVSAVPDSRLSSTAEESVAKGVNLPKELFSPRTRDTSIDNPAAMIDALGFVALGRIELLPEFAMQRANVLPPTSVDQVVFDALNNALNELGPTRLGSPFEPWVQFSSAANPIYRLLALRAAMHTTSQAALGLSSEDPNYTRVDAPAKLGFYLRYLNESDPTILSEAIAAIATVPTAEARQAIEKFQVTQQQRGDAALAQVAAHALRTQELITQGTR